ncbi:MAG: twin-arginine translocase TatA/TatE family subunit [Planctomyces sp.]|nr:twin-arginine translocase TatA/TatE family subunit [Planctomyces sp.]
MFGLDQSTLAFIGGINHWEMLVVLFVALLLFGKRLPEVARSLGKSMTEFKKGMRGFEDELRDDGRSSPAPARRPSVSSDEQVASASKFQPPTSAPVETTSSTNG